MLSKTTETERPAEAPARRPRRGRAKRWLRRAHMYAGIVMLPWLLFFGLSGVLFNHPNVGEDVQGERVSADDLQALSGLSAWDARAAAGQVVEALNAQREGSLSLDDETAPSFEGFTVLTAPAPGGRYMLLMDVERGAGVLVTRKARARDESASFAPVQIELPAYSTATVEEGVRGLLAARDKSVIRDLSASPKIGPELRFVVRDDKGERWNLVYDTRNGEVSGRRADAFPAVGFGQILGKMHTTHHFTIGLSSLWFWALFEDLLGLSMVFWAVSGMIMWWQIKGTRVAGAVSFALALVIAGVVMSGTLDHLTFGDVRQAMGPGE